MVSVMSLIPIISTVLLLWAALDAYRTLLRVKELENAGEQTDVKKFNMPFSTKSKIFLGTLGLAYTVLLSAKVNPVAEYKAPVRSTPVIREQAKQPEVPKDLTIKRRTIDEHSADLDTRKEKGLPFAEE